MDDFYKECKDKLKNSNDSASAVDELLGISIHDLPTMQLCQFIEQAVTLISAVVQFSPCPTQERIIRIQAIRHQLDMTLNYIQQIMEAEKEFPPPQSDGDSCWW